MRLPRVHGIVHILLFLLAIAAMYARIRLPADVGGILAAGAGVLFVINLLWLALSRSVSIGRLLLFLAITLAVLVGFIVGLFVGLQVNSVLGSVLLIAAAAIFVLNIVWLVRAGKSE